MPKKLNSEKPFPQLPRISQINSYYCGPATVQMLLGFLGYEFDQEQIVNAVTTQKKVQMHGITVEELGQAVTNLGIGVTFWAKKHSSMAELSEIVNRHHWPVGVEWQGLFDYPEEGAYGDEDDDPGHVAVVIHVDTRKNDLLIVDPFEYYTKKDRHFTILEFERRWWDINTVINPRTKKKEEVDDYHALFVITPKDAFWPEGLGMKRWE